MHYLISQSQPFNVQCSYHKETSQLIYKANHLTGFFVIGIINIKKSKKVTLYLKVYIYLRAKQEKNFQNRLCIK